MPTNIILASSSPRRQELLRGLGVPFDIEPSGVNEDVLERVQPGKFVEILANRKAWDIAKRHTGSTSTLVIGADTVVILDGEVLGKPRDAAHAFDMLKRLQGRTHQVYSGLCLVDIGSNADVTTHSKTNVSMRDMSDEEIHAYIATGEPMDKAGAYAIQGIGSTLVSSIEGDYFTVVGLPLYLLAQLLKQNGVSVL